jgi:maltoporin
LCGLGLATALSAISFVARADDPTSTQGPPAPAPTGTVPQTPAAAPAPAAPTPATPAATAAPTTPGVIVVVPDPEHGARSPTPNGSTAATATSEHPAPDNGRFEFGSYGRISVASDGRGGEGRSANIVAHGTRIDEDPYVEFELRREDTWTDNIHTKIVGTLAFYPPYYQYTGDLAATQIAVRNLYAQASYGDWTLWVGSRMYRGDDIYLLDWWPLDNQNTIGGGVGVKLATDTTAAFHAGMVRLDNIYQYQQVQDVSPFGFGATNVTLLDRPRMVESLKITQFFRNNEHHHLLQSDAAGFKVILYGEAHELSAGMYQDPLTQLREPAPADSGFLFGAEFAYWTGQRNTFVQVFARHARGLAAYDPLQVPNTTTNDKTTAGSTDSILAIGGNWESGMFGALYGAYVRSFRDGDPSATSLNKFDEGTLVVRPQIYIGQHWGVAVEGSYQERRFQYLDPNTNRALLASEWRGGIIPYFSPSGRGSYARPQLRVVYAITDRNAGSRELYAPDDVFAQRTIEHYIGIGAEWWFNSSSYP